ncbi:MAG TPA: hypothetical protein VFY13_02455 [Luteolibacter sp.]|nr:hypothetical protein [Luteolibacter sp.]
MKLIHTLTIASAVLGLAGTSMAGSSAAAPASCSPDAFNQWTVEASYLYLASEGQYQAQDHESGYRVGVSYQAAAESIGYRLTYTQYMGTPNPQALQSEDGPELDIYDLEAFMDQSYGNLSVEYALGVRYLGLDEPYDGGYDVGYSGIGPVAAVELSYPLAYGFSLYGNFRTAYTFGSDANDELNDQLFMIQTGFGLGYDLAGLGLPNAYAKVGYEFQNYIKGSYGKENAEISGLNVTIGYSF